MKDACAREITYLRLSVTDLCDLRCRYCMPPEGVPTRSHDEICSVEELVEIVRQAAALGIRKVRLTGGEPLVRRGILDICRGIAALEGVEELCLTTNGTALSRLAAPLREAGVDRLNVSLDTLRSDRFAHMTRGGRLEDVLSGLEAARAAGFTGTKLNVVLMKGFNEDEIPAFVDLTRREPLEVRFIELMPIGEGTRENFLPSSAVLSACPELEAAGPAIPDPWGQGAGGADRASEPLLLRRVRPYPGDGGRQAEALSPLAAGDCPPGTLGAGAAPGYPGGNCRQAAPASSGGNRPQRGGPDHESDWRMKLWS